MRRIAYDQKRKNNPTGEIKTSHFHYLLKHSEKVAEKLWGNKENDVWDTI